MSPFRLRFAVLLALALVVSAFMVTPAFADGETPPPPDEGTTVTTDASSGEATPAPIEEASPADTTSTDVVATEEAAPTDAATDESSPEVVASESTASDSSTDTTVADALTALPEGTDLVVLNADGEEVSLASEEASDILISGDPIWCPSGVAPNPGVGLCSPTQASIDDLVTFYDGVGGFPSNGVIWVKWDATLGGTIDGSGAWAAKSIYSITIQGGWEGTAGSTALHVADPYTYFTGAGTDRLVILDWIGSITLKNLVFNSVDDSEPNEYASLWVETAGNILLDKVTANDANNTDATLGNEGHGAVLNNTSGVGNVTVSNSTFNNNEGYGLVIQSKGTVTLKNIYAYGNGYSGIYVTNATASTAKPVLITNASVSDNGDLIGDFGLVVFSKGAITVSNITADLNGSGGAKLDNSFATAAAPVYVNGVNSFNGNLGGITTAGLYVESNGLIKVSSTTANGNGGSGVWLTNWDSAPFTSGITISGFVNTNGNGSVGLEIYSSGLITAANVTANNNNFDGAILLNTISTTPQSVLITGTNTFNNNGTTGLTVQSEGTVMLNSLTANNNGYDADYDGVVIKNNYDSLKQMAVTLNGSNTFLGNSNTGLSIESYGVVTLNNITALNNGHGIVDGFGAGVRIENTGGAFAKAVSIKGTNIFSDNENRGLWLNSDGAIAVSNTTANGNGGTGVDLDNAGSPVSSAVTITSYLIANDNGPRGLVIDSTGSVVAANLTTNGNGEEGTQIINTYSGTPKNVTLTGYNTFNSNGFEGLVIFSRGTVLLNNLTANDNGFTGGDWGGALIDNDAASTVQMAVTLNGVNTFWGNSNIGLSIDSFGVITLSNVTAIDNGLGVVNGAGSGAYLENISGLFAKAVSIKGTNVFNGNDGVGLSINSAGAITLSKVTADYNGIGGALLVNSWSSTQSNVIISGYGVFNTNGSFGGTGVGLDVSSYGAITLANITAQYNMGSGADLYTVGQTVGHAVTLTGINSFNYNGDSADESGLLVNADGNITVSNLTASYNYSSGAILDNYTNWDINDFVAFGSVFVNGFGIFVGNETVDGLDVYTHGNITLNRVSANGNGSGGGDAGLELWAGLGGGIGNITMTCSSAYGNVGYGLYVNTPGILTLKGFLAYGNVDDEDLTASSIVRTVCP